MKMRIRQVLALILITVIMLSVGTLKVEGVSGLTAYIEEIYGSEVIIIGDTLPNTPVTIKLVRMEDNNIRYTDETKSDRNGKFEFDINIEAGKYKAMISAIGLSVETICNVNDINAGTVTVRVEGKDNTLLNKTRVDVQTGYTTYCMAVKKALKDNNIQYTEKNNIIVGIGCENEGASSEGWQWMVNGVGGQILPTDLVNEYDDIVLVLGDLWNPTITRLKISPEIGTVIDEESIEINKGSLLTVKLEQFNVDVFGDISTSPVPNQIINFNNQNKKTDDNGEVIFSANDKGIFIVSCEPTKNQSDNFLIRPVPIIVNVKEDTGSGSDDVEQEGIVTISIDTETIGGGYFIKDKEIELQPRDTVYDILNRAVGYSNVQTTGSGSSIYVSGIKIKNKWIGEFDYGSGSGWMYNVNGVYPNISAGTYRVQPGDEINWRYTTNLGEDLGSYVGDTPLEEQKDLDISNIKNEELREFIKNLIQKKMTDSDIKKETQKVISKIIKQIDVKEMTISEIKDTINDLNIIADVLVEEIRDVSYIEKILKEIIKNMGNVKNSLGEESINYQNDLIETIQKSLNKKSKIKIRSKKVVLDDVKDIKSISRFNKNIIRSIQNSKITTGKKLKFILTFDIDEKIEKIIIPKNILKKIIESNMKFLKLNFKLITIEIPINQLSFDKDMIISTRNMNDYTRIQIIPNKKFTMPLTIKIPCKQNEVEKTVVRKDIKGNKENLGGIYDKNNNRMIFTTNESGKYYIVDNFVQFNDLQKYEWAKESINRMAIKGIINGKSKGLFAPSDDITRAEFSALLVRITKFIGVNDVKIFDDVDVDKWYINYINTAYNNNLMEGKSQKIFDPHASITRQELAQSIANVLKLVGYESDGRKYLDKFNDCNQISEWAMDGVNLSAQFDLIKGINGKFKPKNNATRAEATVMLDRLYNLIIN